LIVQPDQKGFEEQRDAMLDKLDRLEKQLTGSDFFNGDRLSLVDLSFTPFFQRLGYVNDISAGFIDSARHPKVVEWATHLLSQEIVMNSTVPEIKQLYTGMMKKRNGYLSTLMSD